MEDAGGDLRARYGVPAGRPVVLFFGGIRPSKGVPDLIEAFADARSEVEASLLIAGHPAGVEPADLEDLAERRGVAADVVVDPRYIPLAAIGPLLRTATLVALPYRSATASGVLQTAYAFERPVVITDVGGLPEAVHDGITGLVVPPGDRHALARALVKLLADPVEASRMGIAGRRLAEQEFSWSDIAGTVAGVCRQIPGDRP
jgi:glycosyltransferase involved in cell wall biosynthesis